MNLLQMPKISIITITLNNVRGLQKTIKSVFAQTFVDLEYLVIDGSSTDGSKELLEKYQSKFVYWVSEKDKGIYNAMNKGIMKANGEYLLFLNSGDYLYCDNSLKEVFDNSNNEDIIYGDLSIDTGGKEQNIVKIFPDRLTFKYFLTGTIPHGSSIIKKKMFEKWGLYNENNRVVSDWEFFIKTICLYQSTYKHINRIISCFQADGISSQIENSQLILEERQIVLNRYFGAFLPDYIKAEEDVKDAEARLQLYKNSRLHKTVEKVISLPLYKYLKGWVTEKVEL